MSSTSNIRWAFNSASIMNCPWEDELTLWQDFGWNAAEIWFSKLEPQLAKGVSFTELSRQMREAGVDPIGMCAAIICTPSSEKDDPENLELAEVTERLDAAAAMDAKSLTIITDGLVVDSLAAEYGRLVPKLRRFTEMAAERGLKLNLEFLGKNAVNGTMGSCIELVNAVNHPSLGMLFDFCHYYVSASHIEELGLLPAEKLFLVHVNDVRHIPMEVVQNEERCFPGEGRMNVVGMMNHFRNVAKYEGYFSIELYDQELWKLDPRESMQRLADSLRKVEEQVLGGVVVA